MPLCGHVPQPLGGSCGVLGVIDSEAVPRTRPSAPTPVYPPLHPSRGTGWTRCLVPAPRTIAVQRPPLYLMAMGHGQLVETWGREWRVQHRHATPFTCLREQRPCQSNNTCCFSKFWRCFLLCLPLHLFDLMDAAAVALCWDEGKSTSTFDRAHHATTH